MPLTHSHYRSIVRAGLIIAGVIFIGFEFLSNLVLHVKHGQTMLASLGLAAIGTIIYALVVAAIVAALYMLVMKFVRAVLLSDQSKEKSQ